MFYVEQEAHWTLAPTRGRLQGRTFKMKERVIQPPFTAFKEWHAICQSLESGGQSVILRKGGIAEGREGFAFSHREFLLFPTFFHAQYGEIREAVEPVVESNETRKSITFNGFCRIERCAVLRDWDAIERLQSFHIWKSGVLRERFEYGDQQALHLAVVRAFRLENPLTIPFEKRFGGCRSWVSLPLTEPLKGLSVLGDEAFEGILTEISKCLNSNTLRDF